MENVYATLLGEGEGVYTDRKSEFIGHAKHIESEEDALEYISFIRKKYSDARHNVYAYILKDGNIMRYSDDSEPQGTAGLPILDVMRKSGFTDSVIVVTRYFGGILLGTGGLVKAYTEAARIAFNNAVVSSFSPFSIVEVSVDYSFYQKVPNVMKKNSANEEKAEFTDFVKVTASLPKENAEAFISDLFSLSCGKYKGSVIGESLRPDKTITV